MPLVSSQPGMVRHALLLSRRHEGYPVHMPSTKRWWTVDDVHRLPQDGNRYEVIDGELFVTPAPSWRHQEAVVEMHRLLRDYLRQHRVGHAFVAPADVIFSAARAVQPDVFVVPLVDGHRPESFDDVKRLLVAVEVLSATTARADRVATATQTTAGPACHRRSNARRAGRPTVPRPTVPLPRASSADRIR